MIVERIRDNMKTAMRDKDKARLSTIRMVMAAFKQYEVDQQKPVDDQVALTILDKLLKQRRDSVAQYEQAGRQDLADKEQAEIAVIQEFMPEPLTEAELDTIVRQAIAETRAESIKDMGKVMALVKPQVQGRADMGQVGQKVKAALA
jgi:hypothetical protein